MEHRLHRVDGLAVGLRGLPLGRGAARRRDRGEPRARPDVRQLALRLGRADRGRPRRGSRSATGPAARSPTGGRRRYLFVGAIALGAGLVLAIPVVDDWVLEQVVDVGSRPAARPARRGDRCSSARSSVVLASVSPIAVRLAARSIDRLGRTAGQPLRDLHRGQHRRHVRDRVLARPRVGTDQVLAVGAVVLLAAAAAVALLERLWLPGGRARRRRRRGDARRRRARARDERDRLEGAAARNWSPLYREREHAHAADARPAEVAAAAPASTVREARDTRYHRHRRRRRRGDPLPPLRQLVPERHVPRRPVPDAVRLHATTSTSGSRTARTRERSCSSASAAARPRSGIWRDFPRLEIHGGRARPGGRRRRLRVVRAAARPHACRSRSTTAAGSCRRHDERYDVIVIDAFYADSIPFHLATLEFCELVRDAAHAGRRRRRRT